MRHLSLIPALFMSLCYLAPASALQIKDGEYIFQSLEDYRQCQSGSYSGKLCQNALDRWVEEHPEDMFQAGKLTRLSMNHYNAVPYFAQSPADISGFCQDKDVSLAVVSALGLQESSDGALIKQAKTIAFDRCFDALKAELKSNVADDAFHANTCVEMHARGALSKLQQKRCKKLQ